jgi:phosphoribosylformylglycinamidine synthase
MSTVTPEMMQAIKTSGVLYNPRKESEVILNTDLANRFILLVQAHDDHHGHQTRQTLTDHFNITGIQHLQHSVIWMVTADENCNIVDLKNAILNTHIFYNPYAHDCYDYQPIS